MSDTAITHGADGSVNLMVGTTPAPAPAPAPTPATAGKKAPARKTPLKAVKSNPVEEQVQKDTGQAAPAAPLPTVARKDIKAQGVARFTRPNYGGGGDSAYTKLASSTLRAATGVSWKVLRSTWKITTEAQAERVLAELAKNGGDLEAALLKK